MSLSIGDASTMRYVSYNECEAMKHLSADGRTVDDIAFMLERKAQTVRKHVNGHCDHY